MDLNEAPIQNAEFPEEQPERSRDGYLAFVCNVCGCQCELAFDAFDREGGHCADCGSSVRARAFVRYVSEVAYAKNLEIPKMLPKKQVSGVGLSDWEGFARHFNRLFSYTNTYYTREPQLDITNPPRDQQNSLDFITSSDVFEHVIPPVERAFAGAFHLLKPGGRLILSVPSSFEETTLEHFPELHDFEIIGEGADRELINRTRDGRVQRFSNLNFHGGEGATLEMRLFSLRSLDTICRQVGFTTVSVRAESDLAHGIVWQHPWSIPIIAIKPH